MKPEKLFFFFVVVSISLLTWKIKFFCCCWKLSWSKFLSMSRLFVKMLKLNYDDFKLASFDSHLVCMLQKKNWFFFHTRKIKFFFKMLNKIKKASRNNNFKQLKIALVNLFINFNVALIHFLGVFCWVKFFPFSPVFLFCFYFKE